MKKIAEEWLRAAADDLRVIKKIYPDKLLTNMVAFHAQQCIEKSFKAVMEEYEEQSIKVHNLERLLEIVGRHLKINIDIVQIQKLDKLYLDARYPGDLGLLPDGKPNIEDAESFYNMAKRIHMTIKSRLVCAV